MNRLTLLLLTVFATFFAPAASAQDDSAAITFNNGTQADLKTYGNGTFTLVMGGELIEGEAYAHSPIRSVVPPYRYSGYSPVGQ